MCIYDQQAEVVKDLVVSAERYDKLGLNTFRE